MILTLNIWEGGKSPISSTHVPTDLNHWKQVPTFMWCNHFNKLNQLQLLFGDPMADPTSWKAIGQGSELPIVRSWVAAVSRRRAWAVLWRSSLECIRSLQQLGFEVDLNSVGHPFQRRKKMFRFRKVLEEIRPTNFLWVHVLITPNFLAGSDICGMKKLP